MRGMRFAAVVGISASCRFLPQDCTQRASSFAPSGGDAAPEVVPVAVRPADSPAAPLPFGEADPSPVALEPPLLWERPARDMMLNLYGHSREMVVARRFGGKEVVAIDLGSGQERWTTGHLATKTKIFHMIGERVLITAGEEVLRAYGAADGQPLWRAATGCRFPQAPRGSGDIALASCLPAGTVSSSPTDAPLVALDMKSGATLWRGPAARWTTLDSDGARVYGLHFAEPSVRGREVEAFSATDGVFMWSRSFPFGVSFVGVRSSVVVLQGDDGPAVWVVRGLRGEDGHPLWTRRVPFDGTKRVRLRHTWWPCFYQDTVLIPAHDRIEALDLHTGRTRQQWRVPSSLGDARILWIGASGDRAWAYLGPAERGHLAVWDGTGMRLFSLPGRSIEALLGDVILIYEKRDGARWWVAHSIREAKVLRP